MKRLATILGGVLTVLLAAHLLDAHPAAAFEFASPVRIGVVVGGFIAAIFMGEFARLVRLPRVVGYLFVGVLLGPIAERFAHQTGMNFPSAAALFGEIGGLLTGAVAIVGLAIGLRFRSSSVRSSLRSIMAFAIVPMSLIATATGALLLAANYQFGLPQLALLDGSGWTFAILLGLLLAMSSPIWAWGTNAEFHAEGAHTDTQIQVALLGNAGALGALLLIAGAHVFDGAGAAPYQRWIVDVGVNLGTTLGFAIAVALLLLATLRWLRSEIVPVGVFVAILVGLIAPDFPGFAFVGGIVAGAVVASASQFSHAIAESLDRGSPLTLSIVVLHVGLLLELPLSGDMWLLAVAITVARAVAVAIGAPIAIRIADLSDTAERLTPTASLSQGFAPLLAAVFVLDVVPGSSGLLFAVTPVILINAVLGPIVQRRALVALGHHQPARNEVDAPRKRRGHLRRSVTKDARPGGLDTPESLLPPAEFDIPELGSPSLVQVAERVRGRLERTMDRIAAGYFSPARSDIDDVLDVVRRTIRQHVRETVEAVGQQQDPNARLEMLRARRLELDQTFLELFRSHGSAETEGLADGLDTIFRDLQRIADLPATLQAAELPELWQPELGDTRWTRIRKTIHRASNKIGPPPARAVPVRAVGSQVLARGIVARLEPAVNMIGQKRLYLWHKIEIAWSELDSMYARSLDRIDRDAGRFDLTDPDDEVAELDEFDRRLAESDAPTFLSVQKQTDGTVEELLKDEAPPEPDDPVAAFWRVKLEELSFEHEQLVSDVHAFEADTRRRMALAFAASFQDFMWALQRAGTFLLPTRALAPRGVEYHLDAEERTQYAARHWRSLVNSHLDQRAMRLQLRILQADLHPLLDRAVEELSRELASHLTYYPAEISERCSEVVVGLGASIDAEASSADLLDAVVQLRMSTSQFLQDDALQDLQEVRKTNRFSELLNGFVDELSALVGRQPDVFSLPSHDLLSLGETESAGHIDHVDVPFRQILERSFVSSVASSMKELDLRIRGIIDRVASGLGEVNRVVSFNLDAAATELRADDGTEDVIGLVSEFAIGGLKRAGQSASELLEGIQQDIDEIETSLVSTCVDHLAEARDILLDENATSLAARAQTITTVVPEHRRRATINAAKDRLGELAVKASKPITRALHTAEERFALDTGTYEDLQTAGATASFDRSEFANLPTAYRRLFAPIPVEIPEIYVPRPQAAQAVERAVRRWRTGHRTALAVLGESGIGKTSFVHRMLAEQLGDVQMVRWNLRERITSERDFCEQLASLFGVRHVFDSDRLANALREVSGDRMVLLDGLENLYLRAPGEDGAIQALLNAIARSPANIIWVATSNTTLFHHLGGRLRATDVFTDSIFLQQLDRDELEQLVMKRHSVSGYRLVFLDYDDSEPDSDKLKDKHQLKLRRRFFDRLRDMTDGCPRLAMFHWLRAVETTEDENVLIARPPAPLRVGHVRQLGIERQIALGHLCIHGELSEADFARLERCDIEEARRRLAFLQNLGVVTQSTSRRDHARLNDVLSHQLAQALRSRNVIS